MEAHAIDFGARHFKPVPSEEPSGTDALRASAKGIRSVASSLARFGPDKTRALILLGLDHARRLAQADAQSAEPWKLIGQMEMLREEARFAHKEVEELRSQAQLVRELLKLPGI